MADSGIPFRFKRHARIGEAGAELDDEFLFQSFVDVGDYEEIRNVKVPKRVIVGRTGSGKTALLRYLAHREEHMVELEPDQLSLNFISNNDVIRFFEDLGVKLDPFYSLLWKHMLAVELIKRKYMLVTEEKTDNWLATIMDSLRKKDQTKARALAYLKDWVINFGSRLSTESKNLRPSLPQNLMLNSAPKAAGLRPSSGRRGP